MCGHEFMDKTPQIAQLSKLKKQSFKDTKVSVSVFSADISKREEISRWRPIDKTLHYDFSASETFFFLFLLKTAHPQRLAF